jgi:predicted dehydrogenase
VLDKVRESGLKLQVGVQGMSDDSYSSAQAAIKAGKLGPVVEAQIDYVRPATELGPWRTGVDPDLPQPPDLDWETWLGPAPSRPWSAQRFFEWRVYRDYSGGIATDLFIHRLTRILRACDLGLPTRVVGMGGIYLWKDGRDLPDNLEMLAEYPAVDGVTPGMTVHVLGTMANGRSNDHVIRGRDASLIFTREGWDIEDQVTGEVVEQHQKTGAEDVRLHHRNLHSAIRGDEPLLCDAEMGLYGVAAVNGAVDSWFEKKMLTWDSQQDTWV